MTDQEKKDKLNKLKERLDEAYTEFAPSRAGSYSSSVEPTGKFGKWLSKFFTSKGRPPHVPDKETRGDTYKAEELLDVEGAAPSIVRGMIKLPRYEQERKKRYTEYEDMDNFPEVNAALDIYADDGTQRSIENNIINVQSSDQFLKDEIESLLKKLEMGQVIWDLVRNTGKYGDCFIETIHNLKRPELGIQRLKILNPNYILRVENAFGYLKHFVQEIPQGLNLDMPSNTTPKKHILLDRNQIVHFRVHTSDPAFYPYGKSLMSSCIQAYRSLRLMEEAMLIYRLVRAPERRVFYIDVGNMPASKAEAFIERQKAKFKKEKFFNPNTNSIDERFNPLSADEDFFVPTRRDSKASRIETLPGAQNLGEVEDVKYFRDKLLSALKVPKDFIVEKDSSPERKANLSQLDVKFARAVVRLQREIEIGLTTLVRRHLTLRQFPKSALKNFEVSLNPPSDIYEKRRLELDDSKIRVVQAAKALGLFSDEYLYENYFNMSEEDITKMKKQISTEQEELAQQQQQLMADQQSADQSLAMAGGMVPPEEAAPGMESDIETPQEQPAAEPQAQPTAQPPAPR